MQLFAVLLRFENIQKNTTKKGAILCTQFYEPVGPCGMVKFRT